MTPREVQDLFAFDRWANDELLRTTTQLPLDDYLRDMRSSHGGVRGTLVHVMHSDWVWLQRLKGVSPTQPPANLQGETADVLAQQWRAVQAEWGAYVDRLDSDALDVSVAYNNLKGDPFVSQLHQILRHRINHSTYHRGQVVTMLRQLGATPPVTDLIVFYRRAAPLEA